MAHILIVDDDSEIQRTLGRILIREGYTVSLASNGIEAIRSMGEQPADLVIMDILMPQKNGNEAIIEIKSKHSDVKVIAISGGGIGGPEFYLRFAKQVGADKTINKPFNPERLIGYIRELLPQ